MAPSILLSHSQPEDKWVYLQKCQIILFLNPHICSLDSLRSVDSGFYSHTLCICLWDTVCMSHLSPAHYAPSAHESWSTWSHPSCRCGRHGCWGTGRSLQHTKHKNRNKRCKLAQRIKRKLVSVRTKCGVWLMGYVYDGMISVWV